VVGVVTVALLRIAGMVLLVVGGGGGGVSGENCVGSESSFTSLNVPLGNWRVQTGSLNLRHTAADSGTWQLRVLFYACTTALNLPLQENRILVFQYQFVP